MPSYWCFNGPAFKSQQWELVSERVNNLWARKTGSGGLKKNFNNRALEVNHRTFPLCTGALPVGREEASKKSLKTIRAFVKTETGR